MVFENLLAPLLERFLGQYIVDLPREQLRVGVWSGVVRLENVRLKPAAFDHLKLPFAVREGTIGLVELKLALKTVLLSARQHPFVITLDAISVTASPRTEDEWAAEPAAKRALALKRAALAAAAAEIAATKKRKGRSSAPASSSAVLDALWAPLLDRLRLKVGSVHVRFADVPRIGAVEFHDTAAIGIRLDSLLVATPGVGEDERDRKPGEGGDDEDEPSPSTSSADDDVPPRGRGPRSGGGKTRSSYTASIGGMLSMVTPVREARKRVEVKGLRVYSHVRGDRDDPEEWCPRVTGCELVRGGGHNDDVHEDDVIIGTDDLCATLTLTARSKVLPVGGKDADDQNAKESQQGGFDVKLELHGEVSARTRPSQARSLMRLGDQMKVYALRERHGADRPVDTKDWREWWRYAIKSVMRDLSDKEDGSNPKEDLKRAVNVMRYVDLYRKRLEGQSKLGTKSLDESVDFGEDEFYDCEQPDDQDIARLELYSLENELSLEELLTARNRAEELMHDDEDDGEFHDAEESELESDFGMDDDEDTGETKRKGFRWAASALYRRGQSAVTSAVGLAVNTMASTSTYVFASSERARSGRPAFTLIAECFSITLCAETEKQTYGMTRRIAADAVRVEVRGIKVETWEGPSTSALALSVGVHDMEAWMVMRGGDDEGDGNANRIRAVWRRSDSQLGDSGGPVVKVTQRRTIGGSERGEDDSTGVQPLEVAVAPLAIVAHSRIAAALAAFPQEIPGSHFGRLLSSTCGLRGDSFRERLVRATTSIDLELRAQPWRLAVSHTLFLLPSAHTSNDPKACADSCAAALEISRLAVEWSPGGARALTASEIGDVRAHAEALVCDPVSDPEDVNEALFALEQAASTHQVAAAFSGVQVSVPVLRTSRAGGGFTWSPLFDEFSGRVTAVMRSLAVGGGDASNRVRARLGVLHVGVTPAVVSSLVRVQNAVEKLAAEVDASAPRHVGDAFLPFSSNPALDLDLSMEELSVAASSTSTSALYVAKLTSMDARVGRSRSGHAWITCSVQSAGVDVANASLLRVNALRENMVDVKSFLRVDGCVPATGHGPGKVNVEACGVEAVMTSRLIVVAAEFAGLVDATGGDVPAGGPRDQANYVPLLGAGRRRSVRRSLHFLRNAVESDAGTLSDETRDADWAALADPFPMSLPEDISSKDGDAVTFSFALATTTRVVMFEHREKGPSETSGEPVAVVDVSTAEHASVVPRSAKSASAQHSFAVRNVRVWSPASSPATADVLPSSDPGEKDAVLLNVGVKVKADAFEGSKQPVVDVSVTHVRAGAHSESVARIARFGAACAKHAAAFSPPATAVEDASSDVNGAASFEPGCLTVKIADASVFVPSPRRGDPAGYSDGRGLLLALGGTNLSTRLPFASAWKDDPSFALASFGVQSIRLAATEPEEYEWIVALQPQRSAAMNRRPMIHADPINVPALVSVGAVRGIEKPSEALSISVEVPLVSCTLTPTSAGLVLDAARAFSAADFGENPPASAATEETTVTRDSKGSDWSVNVAVDRVSALVQSSDEREGEFGGDGEEISALITSSGMGLKVKSASSGASTALKIVASFDRAHVLDVSATAAGEAERMAAGVKLGAEQDVGVSLAWIGVVSGDESHRSTLTARALFDDATEAPTSAGLDVALGGGGFAVNIPAWDRVVALGSALAGAHDGDTDAVKGQEVSHASPLAPVAEDDSKPKKPSPPLIVKSAFSTGEWTVTLPWKPSETDARAMRLVVDARASASASLDVNAGYAVKGWGGAVTLDRLSLDVWENLPDLSQRTHSLAEAKGVSLSATSDQSDWSTGVSLDLVVRDVSAAVSTRRMQLIKELQGLLDDGAAPPHARSHGGSSAQKEAKTSVPLAFPPISMSVQLDTVGTLIVNDGDEDETIGVPLVEAAVLGLSASLTADADTRSGLRVSVNVETQALVDFLNHRKGAWEPIVEPWRVRVGVDALIAPEKTSAPTKIGVKVVGVDQLEFTATEAGAVATAAAALALLNGVKASGSTTNADDEDVPSKAALQLQIKTRRQHHSYWLHNATTSPVEYWLEGDQTMANGDADRCGTVPGGERMLLCFPDVKSRAAPRYSCVAGVETLVSPAPAPPPAPIRAVVLRVEGCAAASKPIVLDRAAAYVLDASNGSNASADGSSDARLVAEVRQVVDAQEGSRELSGTVRSELLLRSDLAFQNATLTPVELRFDRRLSVALSSPALAVAAGQRVWLPVPLAGGSARVQWRPLPEPDEARSRGSAIKVGGIRRGDSARGSLPDLPDASEYGWSDPVSLRTLAAAAAAVTDSNNRPEPPHATAASRWGSRATGSESFRCIVTAHHSRKASASVVALAPPLYLTNSLPVSVSVSVGSGPTDAEASPDRRASSRAEHRRRRDYLTVAPGATVAVHDGAVDALSTVDVHVRPSGYTKCPAVAVPVMPRTEHGDEAEGAIWSARREVFFADDGTPGRLARRVPVSLKIEAAVDEHGARRVRVSCPTSAVNRSTDPLILQQVRPPRPNTFGKGDAASLGLAGSDLRGWAKRRRDRESRVKTPGEGDCWLPAATEVVTLADASGGEVVRPRTPRRSHGPGSSSSFGVVAMSSPRKLTESQAHGNAHISSRSQSPPLSVHDVAMSASDGFSESMSASASETSLARDSGTRKYNTDDEGAMLGHRSPRQLETVRAIDASVGLSPGDGQIRVHDGSPMDAVPRRGSFPTAFRDSSAIAAVDAGSTNWSPGVAMYGRSPHNESQSELVIPQFVRFRSPDATHWSATTRLNPGDRPVVVRCPATLSPAACYEYLVSLRNPLTNAGSVGGTVSVRPRFVVRGNPLGSTDAIWFRQPESAHAGRLLAGRDESVTLWGDAMGPRSLRFRPDGGAWSWSAAVPVDRPGVIYVKTACLTRDPAEIARLVSKMSSGLTTPGSPSVSRRLGFHSPPLPGTPRRSNVSPRPSTYVPGSSSRPCRVFCVAVAQSRSVKGGWETEVSELGPGEIDAVAPVKFENRSGTTVSFRQADAPRTSAGDDVVEPGQVAAYAWDDPFGSKKLVVSIPGSEYATTVAVEPDPDTDDLDFDEDEDEDEETGMVTRQIIARFVDEKRPNALLRLRIVRSETAGVPCVVTVEEADAHTNTAAAASHRASAEIEAVRARLAAQGASPIEGIVAPVQPSTPASPASTAKSGPTPQSGAVPGSVSPVATRVMTPMLPRRLRPIAKALAFAADVSRAAVKTSPPPLSIEVVLEIPSVGLSVVDAQGSVELLYARVAGARAAVLGRGVGSISDVASAIKEGSFSLRVAHARADLQTPGAASQPTVFSSGGSSNLPRGAHPKPALAAKTTVARQQQVSAGARPGHSTHASWEVQSLLVDTAPLVVDLREELLLAAPRVAAGFARPFRAVGQTEQAGYGDDNNKAKVKPSRRAMALKSARSASGVPPEDSVGVGGVRVGPFDVVVSFTALPFLPWGVRSIGAVDKARVSLRPFQLPSPISPKPPAGSSVWTAEQVATLATRHYIAEAAGQVVKFVASNKLLGDPARFWSQISGAVVELRSAPARRGAGRRFRRRIASAVAEAAKTTLQHAREVTGEVEARFLEARELRAARLRLRRIEDPDQENVDGGESNVPGSRVAPSGAETSSSSARVEHPTWEVVVGVLRAAGSLVEAPLQGAELRGIPGFLEGAAEGAMGAAANVTSATLTLASALVDKLAVYGDSNVDEEESSGAQSSQMIRGGRGGVVVTPRLRPPRPPPANHLEPLLPFNGVEAMARELHQYAAGGRFARECFVAGAKLVRPRGAFVAVTDKHVIVGVNVGSSSETGASKWLAREALPLEDVVTVSRGGSGETVVVRALPRRTAGGRSDRSTDDGGGGLDRSGAPGAVAPAGDSALELVLRPVAYVAALAHRLGREGGRATPANAEGGAKGTAAMNGTVAARDGRSVWTEKRRSAAPGLGIREVEMHCADEACAGALERCLVQATRTSGREARGVHLA